MAVLNEVGFGSDNFSEPLQLSRQESLAQIFLNLFLLRPGSYPSMPHLGIDVMRYMYRNDADNIQEEIKEQLLTQCSELISEVSLGDIRVIITDAINGEGILLIVIPLEIDIQEGNLLVYGFQVDKTRQQLLYNYQFDEMSIPGT